MKNLEEYGGTTDRDRAWISMKLMRPGAVVSARANKTLFSDPECYLKICDLPGGSALVVLENPAICDYEGYGSKNVCLRFFVLSAAGAGYIRCVHARSDQHVLTGYVAELFLEELPK